MVEEEKKEGDVEDRWETDSGIRERRVSWKWVKALLEAGEDKVMGRNVDYLKMSGRLEERIK